MNQHYDAEFLLFLQRYWHIFGDAYKRKVLTGETNAGASNSDG